jgi:RNA 3'-terminal phosphate cyclase (ATP)
MIVIDGSSGEGGGQIIRSSLALSLITGKPFRVERVRANRSKPGLQRQHLTSVLAAAEVGNAEVKGAALGSREFSFNPRAITPSEYSFSIGTAGSTTLVLQTVLPPLMLAASPSVLTLDGGTHNVHAPPFEFLQRVFLPIVNRMGPHIDIELMRYGFYPPGGGRIRALIVPAGTLEPFRVIERGALKSLRGRALLVNLPATIGEREVAVLRRRLDVHENELSVETSNNAISGGNVLTIEIESEHATEIVTGIGERGLRAETVAERAVEEATAYIRCGAPVGTHLADQLLIPMALAGQGSFVTGPLSLHTVTNIETVKKFLEVKIKTAQVGENSFIVELSR